MAYIRALSQADWFFNPGKTPGGLEPTGAAAPPLPGAPGAKTTAPAPAPAPAAESEDEAEEPAATPEKTAAPPVLEKKKGTPIGLYLIGGIALAVIGVILYKKFGSDDVEIEDEAPATIERAEATETTAPLARRKKKR